MKTRNILAVMLICIGLCTATAYADALDDGLDQIFLANYSEEVCIQLKESEQKYLIKESEISFRFDDPAYLQRYLQNTEKEVIKLREWYQTTKAGRLEEAVKLYFMDEIRYAKQYTQQTVFSYLFSEPVWAMPTGFGEENFTYYNMSAECVDHEVYSYPIRYNDLTSPEARVWNGAIYQEGREFLRDHDRIRTQMENMVTGNVLDCKLVAISPYITILYLKCVNGEYGIVVCDKEYPVDGKPVIGVEQFRLYPLEVMLEDFSDKLSLLGALWYPQEQMLDTKPTYEAEAQFLQEQGLLNGNENGLDLLKPLSRIEATTLLVRALGLEQETAQASAFSDVPDTHWGAGYAMRAYENGIVRGVSDTEFAPEQKVTSNQFATMVLRANGEDADWTQATQILIDRGIITEEQAEKMDWFTRGDMAKIVYEAKTKGLI